jgi:predicted nucleotide-binding protein (sugar kinase/HSP70/actin superfamily)
MKTNILLLVTFIAGFAIASVPNSTKTLDYDDTEALIARGVEQMQILGQRSQEVNQAVKTKFEDMKETIEVLEEEKEQLVEQVKVMENEIIAIKSEPSAQPFDVLAIGVPDTADRK